jgi:hypothetical protein
MDKLVEGNWHYVPVSPSEFAIVRNQFFLSKIEKTTHIKRLRRWRPQQRLVKTFISDIQTSN